MKTLLWLDDCRDPFNQEMDWMAFSPIGRDCEVVHVTNFYEFQDWIMTNGLPDGVCFDHDLADEIETGYDCAKFMVRYHQKFGGDFPKFASQSSNPVGRKNILSYLNNYLKHKDNE